MLRLSGYGCCYFKICSMLRLFMELDHLDVQILFYFYHTFVCLLATAMINH